MCGIFGYAGKPDKDKKTKLHRFLTHLYATSESRGTHASGFSCAMENGRIISDKMPLRGSLFAIHSALFDDLALEMPERFIAHTRFGTGSNPIINNNNHPFYGKHYHMVHNGTIESWQNIAEKHELTMTSETDSEVIVRLADKLVESGRSPEHVVRKILDCIWGNMAVAMLDMSQPYIWLFRNENPLYVFIVPAGIFGENEFIFFASTYSIFEDAWKNLVSNHKTTLKGAGISDSYLNSNMAYQIAPTNSLLSANAGMSNWLVHDINVAKPFYKQSNYGSGWSHIGDFGISKTLYKNIDVESFPIGHRHYSKCLELSDRKFFMTNLMYSLPNISMEDKLDGMTKEEYNLMKILSSSIEHAAKAMEGPQTVVEAEVSIDEILGLPEPVKTLQPDFGPNIII